MSLEYTQLDDALELASQRLNNKNLQTKVAAYLGNLLPTMLEEVSEPTAVYAPYLARGSELEAAFTSLAGSAGFKTAIATYEQTRYVTANPAIVDCYKAPLKLPKGQQARQWVVPPEERSGALGKARTVYPVLDIVQYWNGIRQLVRENTCLVEPQPVFDMSEWYEAQAQRFGYVYGAKKSPYYYRALMGLYASGRAVLFAPPRSSFTDTVTDPATELVKTELGLMPIVVDGLKPKKRDWVNLGFLDETQVDQLKINGRVV